eukprot:TRINITY_DN44906_c0_g1_i1.p1 TRINITY_DN44906_c0_g1~~TRINITY_DN44906_c0_g1_i1.p1  ORF type:complete len:820 (+),score=205.06 TRINITY_DN44906_c0_g1_i1:75-2462(+)
MGRAHTPSPRTCRLLGEVARCAGEMQALNQKMGALRQVLRLPEEGPDQGSSDAAEEGCKPSEEGGSLGSFLPASRHEGHSPQQATALRGSCPASSSKRAAGGRCDCDPFQLLSSVCELGDVVENQRVELLGLRDMFQRPPVSPELAALASEGVTLERRARQDAATVATLRTETAALAWSLESDRKKIREIQRRNQQFLDRLQQSKQEEESLHHTAREAARELNAERHHTEEWSVSREAMLGALTSKADAAEERWQSAEASASRLRAAAAEAEAVAEVSLRNSAAEVEEHNERAQELKHRLSKMEVEEGKSNVCTACGKAYLESAVFCRHCGEERAKPKCKELQEQRARCEELLSAKGWMAARLAASQHRAEDTEKKALGVAKELADSSQAIEWLHSEIMSQRELSSELEEVRQHNADLTQRLHDKACSQLDTSQPEVLAPGEETASAADVELQSLRLGQAQAVNRALQAAWEGEAREHRLARRRLQSLELSCLAPARQHVRDLAQLGSTWQQSVLHLRRMSQEGSVDDAALQEAQEEPLPDVPTEALKGLQEQRLSCDIVREICTCLERLALETTRRLRASPAEPAALPAEPTALGRDEEQEQLRAERQSLEWELGQLTALAQQQAQMPKAFWGRPIAPPSRPLPEPLSSRKGWSTSSSSSAKDPGFTDPRLGDRELVPPLESPAQQQTASPRSQGRRPLSSVPLSEQRLHDEARQPFPSSGRPDAPGMTGPLYRLDADSAAQRRQQHLKEAKATRSVKETVKRRQIPVQCASSDLRMNDASDRFDNYSVHRPRY